MKNSRIWASNIMLLSILIIAISFVGCEEELLKIDRVVSDVNTVAQGTQAVLESPAGLLIPPEWKLYGALGVVLANVLIIGWEEWRNRTMKKTTKAIVIGIEKTTNPDKATSEVKANIAKAMMDQGGSRFYKKANKIVDTLKIS